MSQLVVTLLERARHDSAYREWLRTASSEELMALGLKVGQQAVLLSNLLLTSPFEQKELPDWDGRFGYAFPWVDNGNQVVPWTPFNTSVREAKIALVTTAGIYRCGEKPFDIANEEQGDPTYRVIPLGTALKELYVKHHLGLVQAGADGDTGHLFPLRVARRLCAEGVVGELAQRHYSFMGYIPHTQPLIERTAPEVAAHLRAEQVDAVILTPA